MMALAARCKCGVGMRVERGAAYCEHCDRDCAAKRNGVACRLCDKLDKAPA